VGRAAANRVLNRYIARTGDWELVRGLPLFLSTRAMVRAHVEAARSHPRESDAYLKLAMTYLQPAAPVVVAVGGLQGTGKSSLARALAPQLGPAPGAVILRSDEIRKRVHGVAPEVRLPCEAYAEPVSRAVLAQLVRGVQEVRRGGHAAIADATFLDPADRVIVAAAAETPFLGVWLHAPLAVLEARLARRQKDASDAGIAVLHQAAAVDPGPLDWLPVEATDGEAALATVRAALCARLGRD
jgi:predicted kinase